MPVNWRPPNISNSRYQKMITVLPFQDVSRVMSLGLTPSASVLAVRGMIYILQIVFTGLLEVFVPLNNSVVGPIKEIVIA